MHITARSYLTSGITALGVGAIALSPIQPLPDQVAVGQPRAVESLAVSLAATIDPITPWVDTFKTSFDNIKAISAFYLQKPFPLIQTIAANQVTYVKELFGGQAGLIPEQIWNNIQTFFLAPWDGGAVNGQGNLKGTYISNETLATTVPLDIPVSQQFAFGLLPAVLGDSYAQLKPIIDFTATPYSGAVIGLLGPVLAPVVALTRSFTAVGQYFQEGKVLEAINEIINIPANVTNAVLNGAGYFDLTGIAGQLATLPPQVKSIGLNLGGILTPPVPITDTPAGQLPGGVAFDSLAAKLELTVPNPLYPPVPPPTLTVTADDPGIPVGWTSSAIGMGQFLADKMKVVPPPTAAAVAPAASTTEVEAPATPSIPEALVDSPAPSAPAVDNTPAPTAHRGGDSGGATSSAGTGGRAHRG